MLVSVIIPCHNVSAYIEECLTSVLKQDHSPLEIICVDNNSTDNTPQKLLDLKVKHPEILITSETKKGASAARNKGFSMCRGEWVQFLDADDLLHEDKIAHQVKLARVRPTAAFIAASWTRLSTDGRTSLRKVELKDPWLALAYNHLGITSANLFNRKFFEQVNGWDETLASSQEANLMFRLLKVNPDLIFDHRPLTTIRERPGGSISQTSLADNLIRYILLRYDIYRYAKDRLGNREIAGEIMQLLFDKIRDLYQYDPARGLELFRQIIPKDFNPGISAATTRSYLMLYRLLGFKRTEKVKSMIRGSK